MATNKGFGAIRKLPSGRYQAKHLHPHTPFKPNGARHYITAPTTFTTKTAASIWLAQQQADIERGQWKSPEQKAAEQEQARLEADRQATLHLRTFDHVRKEWQAERGHVKDSTRYSEENLLAKHIIPYWANQPLYAITEEGVREWIVGHLAPGSPGSRDHAYQLFRAIIRYGHERDYIPTDPCARIKLSRIREGVAFSESKPTSYARHKPRALETDELEALVANIDPYYRLPVLILAKTGLRAGELRALRSCHIQDDNGKLSFLIHENVTGQGKTLSERIPPKTARGRRTVPVPTSLVPDIRRLARERKNDGGYLFHARSGNTHAPLTLSRLHYHISHAAKRAGIEGKVSPHDLRHTAVSQMIRNGVAPMTVMDIVGHEDDKIVRRYTHQYSQANRVAIETLDRATSIQDDSGQR